MGTEGEGRGDGGDLSDQPAPRSEDPSRGDPSRIPGGSVGLRAIYATIEHAASRLGHGRWRVASDPLDATLEIVVNLALDRRKTHPDDWPRFAIAVYRNLVKKGPPRGSLDVRRTLDWPLEEIPAPEPEDVPPRRDLDIADLPMHRLTDAESKALRAYLEHRRVAQSAKEVGMTRRDFRVRLNRATEKSRSAEG